MVRPRSRSATSTDQGDVRGGATAPRIALRISARLTHIAIRRASIDTVRSFSSVAEIAGPWRQLAAATHAAPFLWPGWTAAWLDAFGSDGLTILPSGETNGSSHCSRRWPGRRRSRHRPTIRHRCSDPSRATRTPLRS
jgi:hypothetical protein